MSAEYHSQENGSEAAKPSGAPNFDDSNALFVLKLDSPAIRKLVRTVASGNGAVAGPALRARMEAGRRRKIADADAYATLKRAEAQKKAMDMLGADTSNEIVLAAESENTISQRTDSRLSFQEEKRQDNIESVAWKAAQRVPEDASEEGVNPDWIARFFENVKDVSDSANQSKITELHLDNRETMSRATKDS